MAEILGGAPDVLSKSADREEEILDAHPEEHSAHKLSSAFGDGLDDLLQLFVLFENIERTEREEEEIPAEPGIRKKGHKKVVHEHTVAQDTEIHGHVRLIRRVLQQRDIARVFLGPLVNAYGILDRRICDKVEGSVKKIRSHLYQPKEFDCLNVRYRPDGIAHRVMRLPYIRWSTWLIVRAAINENHPDIYDPRNVSLYLHAVRHHLASHI